MSTIITPVCRLCLEVIAKEKTFYNIDQQNGLPDKVQNLVQTIREIISFCIPEVDTYLSMNPSICDTCLNNLVQIYNYKKCFLKVEDIIRRHSKANNPIGGNYVDLCNVAKQQYALALKKRRLPSAVIQAQIIEMDLVLKNTTKTVPSYGLLNVMAQNFSDTERRASPSSSKASNNSIPSKYSLRHHVPSLLAASSSPPQPPIDLDNPQNSFLGSLNLISSENPSTSNQGSAPKTGNNKSLMRQKADPKRKLNPAAPADNTIIILDDDSDGESGTNNVETSKNKSSKSDNNEVLIMNYVEENGAQSTATTDEATCADTTDIAEPPIMAAKPTPTVKNLDGKSVTAAATKTDADNGISGTPKSTGKLGSLVIAADKISGATAKVVTNVATGADIPAGTYVDDTTPEVMDTESAGGPAATTADVPNNSAVDMTPEIIMLDDEGHKSASMQQPQVSLASENPKTAEKSVVVKLLPVDLEDLKRKVGGKKCLEEEIPSKRKKVLTVNLNPSLPYLHKNKKLIVKIEKKQFSTCELCDFVTNQGKDAIKQHGLRKHKVCMLCDYQCSSVVLLNKHFNNSHFEEVTVIVNKSKEENDTLICDLCSYKAVSAFDFRDHIVKKHCGSDGSIDYKCPYENCGLKYNQSFNLARHVEISHVLAKKLTCVMCNQKCHSKKSLRIHLQSHIPSGIICLLCGMSFRWNSLLRTHTKNKHPGIDTESNITGMAHDSHDNLTADDNGHITLDSFVNRNALSNEETGANRGTLTTDENGRIVLNLPRPNQLTADPNLVVNLEERCSFEYPSLSEMLCESTFLQQNQVDERAEVVDKASKPKPRSRKRKRAIPKKSKKSKVLKVQDDIDDCMIIDKEIVTVDVSDEEALLITDSDDDCTIVNHNVAIESESDPTTTIENAIKKSSDNKDDNIIISDTESEHSDSVEDEHITNSEKHSKSLNLESETSHKEKQNIVESIIENTNSNKMEEAKENTVESPSTSNDRVDEHSDTLERNISKKCTEVINGADELLKENVSGDAGEKCEEPTRNELLNKRLSDNLESSESLTSASEKMVESTNSASELLKEKGSENLESEKSSTNNAKSSLTEPMKDKVNNSEHLDLEKSSESTKNLHEPLIRKDPQNFESGESDTSADSASVLNALLGENSSESDTSSESMNISDELLKENVSDNNLESEESSARITELCSNDLFKDKVDSKNLESAECSEKPTNGSNEIVKEQVTENMRLEGFSTNIAELLISNEPLKEKEAEHVELEGSELSEDNVDSKNKESENFANSSHKQLNDNLESEESSVKTTELCSNNLFNDKVDSKNLESEKCTEESTNSSNEILKEQVTENVELVKTSAEAAELSSNEKVIVNNMELEQSSENIAESSLNKLLQEVGSKNLETDKSSEKLVESTNSSNDKEGKLFEILDLDGFSVMDADLATSLNPTLETTKGSNELLKENVSEVVADSVSNSYELVTEKHVSNELSKENVSEMAFNFESSADNDLPTSTNELLKETISELLDMKNFTDMCLESANSSNDLLREDNERSNNVALGESSNSIVIDEGGAKLTTNSSNEVVGDFESPRVNLSCQNDATNDVIASTFNSIEQLRIILEDA